LKVGWSLGTYSGHLNTCCKVSFLAAGPSSQRLDESRPGFRQDRPSGGQLRGHIRESSLASKRSFSLPCAKGIRCGIRVGCGEAKQINACIMHLFDWLNCPNFPRVAGLFMLGGSGCLHMYPFFLMSTFLFSPRKDERVEAPG
jgi:hypothetical protein